MSSLSTIVSGVGTIVAMVYPPAAPIVSFIIKAEPYAEKAIPLIQAAIKDGPAAFAAAKAAAPEFFSNLEEFAVSLKELAGLPTNAVTGHEVAVLASRVVGIDPPGWTHEETQRWWDQASGTQADS